MDIIAEIEALKGRLDEHDAKLAAISPPPGSLAAPSQPIGGSTVGGPGGGTSWSFADSYPDFFSAFGVGTFALDDLPESNTFFDFIAPQFGGYLIEVTAPNSTDRDLVNLWYTNEQRARPGHPYSDGIGVHPVAVHGPNIAVVANPDDPDAERRAGRHVLLYPGERYVLGLRPGSWFGPGATLTCRILAPVGQSPSGVMDLPTMREVFERSERDDGEIIRPFIELIRMGFARLDHAGFDEGVNRFRIHPDEIPRGYGLQVKWEPRSAALLAHGHASKETWAAIRLYDPSSDRTLAGSTEPQTFPSGSTVRDTTIWPVDLPDRWLVVEIRVGNEHWTDQSLRYWTFRLRKPAEGKFQPYKSFR